MFIFDVGSCDRHDANVFIFGNKIKEMTEMSYYVKYDAQALCDLDR
ncbi:MAG: hypothetical protein HN882_12710 [Planctomycetaceae bacterium]|nr:hypothetical protein [Planctomycetaceae bacterium]